MKFMIITTNGTYFKESKDFVSVANEIYDYYDYHTGYDNVVGIIKIEEWFTSLNICKSQ